MARVKVAALERLVDGDPLGSLRRLSGARVELDRLEREQVAAAVDEAGASWAQVAAALGRSVTATHRAFSSLTRPQRRRGPRRDLAA